MNFRRKFRIEHVFPFALSLLISGCATVIHGTDQEIPVSSSPEGAAVLVDGIRQGTTPMTVKTSRKHDHIVSLLLDGYAAESVTLVHSMSGAVAGNVLAGGLIGWGVDASNGAQYNLIPESVNVMLRQLESPPVVRQSAPKIEDLLKDLQSLDDLHKSGKLSDDEYAKMRMNVLAKYGSNRP